jgi:ribosomal-protein-alanine N-acetyltransferase
MHECEYLLSESDIGPIAEIDKACFPSPWCDKSFLSELNNPYSLNIILKELDPLEKGSIYAYSFNHIVAGELSILRMAVIPAKRRLGYARYMLKSVFKRAVQLGAKEAFLEVRPSNTKARSLYHSLGFRVIGTRPNYYPETGEDALVMTKSLKEIS